MILDRDRFDYNSMNIYLEQMDTYYENLSEEGDDSMDEIELIYKPSEFEECLEEYFKEVYYKDDEDYSDGAS